MRKTPLDRLALVLMIIALNWLLVGLFNYDLVAAIFGGNTSLVSRIVYTIVGIAVVWNKPLIQGSRNGKE